MASLVGWYGHLDYVRGALARMTDAVDGVDAVHEEYISPGFAVRTSQPGLAGEINRTAVADNGRTIVAFAGYLYTEDDTERASPASHCLRLYEEHGVEFAAELNGTFAVAVFDDAEGKLHLVSDRLSTRPMYYTRHAGGLLFATEVTAILAAPGFSGTLNEEAMVEFLAIQCVTGGGTLYENIHKLPPGSVLTWDGETETVTRYWAPRFTWDENATVEDSADRIAVTLKAAVRRVVFGHDRAGLLLSGGLDSRVSAAASPVPLHCMTMHTDEGMEVRTARRVAGVLGNRWDFIKLPDTYPMEALERAVGMTDGVNAFHHAQPLYARGIVAGKRLSVVLNGWGLGLFFSGANLTSEPRRGLARLSPPRLAAGLDGHAAESFIEALRVAPLETLENVVDADVAELLRVRSQDLAECRGGSENVGRGYDLVGLMAAGDMSQHRSHVNTRALGRLTQEGIPAWDTEVINAFLDIPPAHRHNHIAYRYAIGRLDRRVVRIPYTATGVPVRHGPLREHWQGALLARATTLWGRARRALPLCSAPPASAAWPDIGSAIVACPRWHEVLRERLAASRLVEMGVINGGALRDVVEAQIDGVENSAPLIGNWLTLERWLEEHHQ